MRNQARISAVAVVLLLLSSCIWAQTNTIPAAISVPTVIRYAGTAPLSVPAGQTEIDVTFRFFAAASGGTALWQEKQRVTQHEGKFTALIGAATGGGVPTALFANAEARWLEVQVGDEAPASRVEFAAAPYALKAADADTVGGKPASSFVLRENANALPLDTTTTDYATLGSNNFVGEEDVNGDINVTGYVNTALATVVSPLVVNQLLWVNSTATTGGVIAIKAQNASVTGTGIMGIVTSTTGNTVGVIGRSDSVVGNGVYGVTTSPTGSAEAISGTAMATQGHGVGGYAVATTGASVGVYGKSYSAQGAGVTGESSPSANGYTTYGVRGLAHGNAGIAVYGYEDSSSGAAVGLEGVVASTAATAAYLINISGGGNLVIGQTGSTKVFRVDTTGKVYADGGVQSNGADFAESIAVRGERGQYQPGDVLLIDYDHDRQVVLASEAYSARVAGVYSTKPGTLSSQHAMDSPEFDKEVPVAVVGIVPCKVTAANGAIHRGDLLVSSAIAGYAMKATDRSRMPGAILGKAMQELPEGTGVIEILVTLE